MGIDEVAVVEAPVVERAGRGWVAFRGACWCWCMMTRWWRRWGGTAGREVVAIVEAVVVQVSAARRRVSSCGRVRITGLCGQRGKVCSPRLRSRMRRSCSRRWCC